MSTAPSEIDDIRRRMAQIRRDLHEDVRGVVEGAEAATDWKRFVRNYPWACTGAALFVGYLLVPRRHRASTSIEAAPAGIARLVAPERSSEVEPKKKGKSWLGTIFGMVAPMAWRAAQGYVMQFAEQWLAQRMAQQMQANPNLAAAFGQQAPPPPPPGRRSWRR